MNWGMYDFYEIRIPYKSIDFLAENHRIYVYFFDFCFAS